MCVHIGSRVYIEEERHGESCLGTSEASPERVVLQKSVVFLFIYALSAANNTFIFYAQPYEVVLVPNMD